MICAPNDFILWMKNSQLSERTIKEYTRYLGKLNLYAELSQEVLNDFLSTNNNIVCRAFLKNLLEFLKRKDLDIPKRKGRVKLKIPSILSVQEIERLRSFFENEKQEIMFLLQYGGAMRVGELMSINLNRIDWESFIENPKSHGNIRVKGKGSKERIAIIPNATMMKLHSWLNKREWPIEYGEKCIWDMSLRRWQEIMEKVSLKALGRKVNTHLLRHSRASHLLEGGMDIRYIQEFLAHSNLNSTQIYTHFNKKKLMEVLSEKGF